MAGRSEFDDACSDAFNIEQLHKTLFAVHELGLDRSSLMICQSSGLIPPHLCVATESLTEAATESLVESIKERVAKWSAKIVNFFKSSGKRLSDLLANLKTKLAGSTDKAISKTLSDPKSAKKYSKGLSVSEAKNVTDAAKKIGDLADKTGKSLSPNMNADQQTKLAKMFKDTVSSITGIFGGIKVKTTNMVNKFTVDIPKVADKASQKVRSIAELGWNKVRAVNYKEIGLLIIDLTIAALVVLSKAFLTLAGGIWTTIKSTFKGAAMGFDSTKEVVPIVNRGIAEQAARGAFGIVGAAFVGGVVLATSLLYGLYKVIKFVVVGALQMIGFTFDSIAHAKDSSMGYL